MFEVNLTKDNETRSLIIFDTEQKTQDFIADRVSKNIFGNVGSYTLSYINCAQKQAQEKQIKDRKLKRSFGESMIDKISCLNESKNLTTEGVDDFMNDPLIISLREHLWAGNISTFIAKLDESDVSAFFSSPEKAAVISECESFLNSMG